MTQELTKDDLRGCPFCASEGEVEEIESDCFGVGCPDCDFQLMTGPIGLGWHKSVSDAVCAWNERHADLCIAQLQNWTKDLQVQLEAANKQISELEQGKCLHQIAEPSAAPLAARGHKVLVCSGALQMVVNALLRDAEEGKTARGEMADELLSTVAPAAPAEDALTPAARDVLAERARQISAEGWTPERDDQYVCGSLSSAAGCYAMFTAAYPAGDPARYWPWPKEWWKPSESKRRNLEKAGALILAEIERIDRATIDAARAAQGGA